MWLVGIVEKSPMEGSHVLMHFPQFLLSEQNCSEGLLPSEEDDVLKQSQVFFSTRWLSARASSYSQPLTTVTAIFVRSHVKK